MAKLTAKQQRFVDEYLIDLNATQAAIRAGYSEKRASEQAYQLIRKTTVSNAISRAMAERSRRTGINADRVLLELARIGFSKITDIVDVETAKINSNASDDDLACIQAIKIKPNEWGTEREIKLYDKKAALVDIGKHLGMFKEKLEVDMDTELNISIKRV